MSISGWKWWMENGKIAFARYDGGTTWSAPGSTGDTVYLDCIKSYDDLELDSISLAAEDPIPKEFHMAIVSGVIADLYKMPGKDLRSAAQFDLAYERGIVRGQEVAGAGGDADLYRTADGVF